MTKYLNGIKEFTSNFPFAFNYWSTKLKKSGYDKRAKTLAVSGQFINSVALWTPVLGAIALGAWNLLYKDELVPVPSAFPKCMSSPAVAAFSFAFAAAIVIVLVSVITCYIMTKREKNKRCPSSNDMNERRGPRILDSVNDSDNEEVDEGQHVPEGKQDIFCKQFSDKMSWTTPSGLMLNSVALAVDKLGAAREVSSV